MNLEPPKKIPGINRNVYIVTRNIRSLHVFIIIIIISPFILFHFVFAKRNLSVKYKIYKR